MNEHGKAGSDLSHAQFLLDSSIIAFVSGLFAFLENLQLYPKPNEKNFNPKSYIKLLGPPPLLISFKTQILQTVSSLTTCKSPTVLISSAEVDKVNINKVNTSPRNRDILYLQSWTLQDNEE